MPEYRIETDSLGEVRVLADKLWGAQTQRSLEHFSIGQDLIPREMITAYAILKKAAANANHAGKRLDEKRHQLIVQVCFVFRVLSRLVPDSLVRLAAWYLHRGRRPFE
jgi:fumarate hydratase class II